MKSLIVSSHPEHGSFNWGMADAARDALKSLGHQVKVLDLLEEDFDPVMRPAQFQDRKNPSHLDVMAEQAHQATSGTVPDDVARSQELLREADNLILQFPLWWWSMPAQLKGWIDRVFSAGFAYGDANLAPRRAMITVTAETKGERFRSEGEAHPLHHIERGMLKFSGYTILPSFVVSDVYSIGAEERRERLKQLQDHVRIHFGQAASIAKAS